MNSNESFSEEELANALSVELQIVEPSAMHVQALRTQLQARLHEVASDKGSIVPQQSIQGRTSKRRSVMFVKAASLSAVVLLAILASRMVVGTAAANLKAALDATRQEAWVHATTVVTQQGESIESQAWCSPGRRIAAFQSPSALHFVNYAEGIQASYSDQTGSVVKWRANMNYENSGYICVQAILTDGDLSTLFPFHSVSEVKRRYVTTGVRANREYSFQIQSIDNAAITWKTTIETDSASGRIVAWSESHSSGLQVTTRFDYPESGPLTIYDLGVSAEATVIDRVASSEVMELADQYRHQVVSFDDYEALVIDRFGDGNGPTSDRPLLRKLWRNGNRFRVELLAPLESESEIPADPEWSWWRKTRDRYDSTLLAECDGETCRIFDCDDPRLDYCADMIPRFDFPTAIPMTKVRDRLAETTIPVWPGLWPEYACRPMIMTDNPALSFEMAAADEGGDPNLISLRLLTLDNPTTKLWATYQLSVEHDHCLSKALISLPTLQVFDAPHSEDPLKMEFSNFQVSPSGIVFASQKVTSQPGNNRIVRTNYLVEFTSGP